MARSPLTVSRTWFCPPRQVRAESTCRENIGRVALLQLAKLRKLQEHVVGIERRDDESGDPVSKSTTREVVAQKRERRVQRQPRQSRARALLVHLAGGKCRVSIDGLQVVGDVAVWEMLQLAGQTADAPTNDDPLVDVPTGPRSRASVVEAKLVVRIPVGRANPSPQVPGRARDAVPLV